MITWPLSLPRAQRLTRDYPALATVIGLVIVSLVPSFQYRAWTEEQSLKGDAAFTRGEAALRERKYDTAFSAFNDATSSYQAGPLGSWFPHGDTRPAMRMSADAAVRHSGRQPQRDAFRESAALRTYGLLADRSATDDPDLWARTLVLLERVGDSDERRKHRERAAAVRVAATQEPEDQERRVRLSKLQRAEIETMAWLRDVERLGAYYRGEVDWAPATLKSERHVRGSVHITSGRGHQPGRVHLWLPGRPANDTGVWTASNDRFEATRLLLHDVPLPIVAEYPFGRSIQTEVLLVEPDELDRVVFTLEPFPQVPPASTYSLPTLDRADRAARSGDRAGADKLFRDAVTQSSSSNAAVNDRICLIGSIDRFEVVVLPACDRAVRSGTVDAQPIFRDSRGLARALSGDAQGAIEDSQAYATWVEQRDFPELGAQRRDWIAALREGRDPFDADTLESLRHVDE